jgi:protein-S-isoprenylcysteine O-methyltransferase Ste14
VDSSRWTDLLLTILLGATAFLLGILFDCMSGRGPAFLKTALWMVLSLLLLYAHVAVGFDADKVGLSALVRVSGGVLLVAGFFMLLYSLFLEIPITQTYVKSSGPRGLVQEGTYALTRHPGVIWYAVALCGLFLASGSRQTLIAGPVWLAMDVLWVWIEDRFIFERVFDGYADYKKSTPMLVPTAGSIRRFWSTFALKEILVDRLGANSDRGKS